MVAMFSFFYGAAEPLFNNCFATTANHNGGYDYLMFSPAATTAAAEPQQQRPQHPQQHGFGGATFVAQQHPQLVEDPPFGANLLPKDKKHPQQQLLPHQICHRLIRNHSLPNAIGALHKAASEPPLEHCSVKRNNNNSNNNCCGGKFPPRRHTNSFHKSNTVRSTASSTRSRLKELRGDQQPQQQQEGNKASNGIGRLLHFFESLNPLNGFKDKDDFEEYLYNQSHKVEPKNGDIPNPKPKHAPEALKSPGVKQQKTPNSANAAHHHHHHLQQHNHNHLHQQRASAGMPKSGGGKSSISSPRSPNPMFGGGGGGGSGGNLLSPTHINVSSWGGTPASGSSTNNNSPASMLTTEEQNFAIVDINPGQFPRWLADSGRINPAFISEYAPSASLLSGHTHGSSNNESPTSPMPAAMMLGGGLRRKPPLPLGTGEPHFTFPPPLHQHQHHGFAARKPPAPPPQQQAQTSEEQSPSFLSPIPAFPLANPPAARKKLPAADPQTASAAELTAADSAEAANPPKLPPRLNVPKASGSQFLQGGSPVAAAAASEAMAPPRPPKKTPGRSPTCENQSAASSTITCSASQLDSEANVPPLPPKPKTFKR